MAQAKHEKRSDLQDLFMKMFSEEFLLEIPEEELKTTIENVRTVISTVAHPPEQWSAMHYVLRERGLME